MLLRKTGEPAPRLAPRSGASERLGATLSPEGVNFAVYSETASAVFVSLFDEADRETARFELDTHLGNVHCGLIAGIEAGARYGLRAEGAFEPEQGLYFDPNKLLIDPYARQIDRPYTLAPQLSLPRAAAVDTAPLVPKALVVADEMRLATPRRKAPSLVYELNIRGYTTLHPEVPGPLRGTVAALGAQPVLNHLKRIGVDCVELMPVTAFIDDLHLPALGLNNAWGYNPIGYFALDPRLAPGGAEELRALTDLYRREGISVVLDVVYNHTGESDRNGPTLSFRGLDNKTYYRHVEIDGRQLLVNDAGTGNTLRCDHPAVQRMVIESLRYFVEAIGVSGFRFDLATVLGREPGFNPQAAMLSQIKADPVLGKCLLIAEPWDPGPGGYGVGQFGPEFREWNDSFRDEVRSFWRGDPGKVGGLASKIAGSSEIFNFDGRRPSAGVNFLAVHDGFTLADLTAYAEKHNEANGEGNRDGANHNASWNCGVEGPTDHEMVKLARARDVRALLATLFVARGTPMLQQGDEMGRTQRGNNNAYAQDNEITWLDWASADRGLIDFVAALARFRAGHPALKADLFLDGRERNGQRDVVWRHQSGREMQIGDWNNGAQSVLGMQLKSGDDEVLVWFNRHAEPVNAVLPGEGWTLGIVSNDKEPMSVSGGDIRLASRSVTIFSCPRAG